jgi:hypothetical protein
MKKLIGLITASVLSVSALAHEGGPFNAQNRLGEKPATGGPGIVIADAKQIIFEVDNSSFYPPHFNNFSVGSKKSQSIAVEIDGVNLAKNSACPVIQQRYDESLAWAKSFLVSGKKYEIKAIAWKGVRENKLGTMAMWNVPNTTGAYSHTRPWIMADLIVDGKSYKELLIEKGFHTENLDVCK